MVHRERLDAFCFEHTELEEGELMLIILNHVNQTKDVIFSGYTERYTL